MYVCVRVCIVVLAMTHMHRHIKVVAFELISHFSKLLQRIFSLCLFEAECLHWL